MQEPKCVFSGRACVERDVMIRERERESEGMRQTVRKKLFLPSLHVKLELLLWQTDSEQIYTHKHAPNHLVRAGSIRHLSNLSLAHSRTHTLTHTCYYHTLIEHSRWGVHSSSEGGRLLLRNKHYRTFSALFFFLSFLSLYT